MSSAWSSSSWPMSLPGGGRGACCEKRRAFRPQHHSLQLRPGRGGEGRGSPPDEGTARQSLTSHVLLLLELNGSGPLPVHAARRAQFAVVVLWEVARVHLHALDVLPHTARVAADHEPVIMDEPTGEESGSGGEEGARRAVGDLGPRQST